MSHDEIRFDEVHYREPARLRRPDRDRAYACVAYEIPGPDELPIFIDRVPTDAIERHALRDTSVELGGILLGKECLDDQTGSPFVWVTQSIEAKHYENTQASFTYTHDSWEEITRERDAKFPDLDVVGWYHTHPDFGVFLSSHDLFIQHHFFSQPLQVAYVVDPIRQTRGFFQWREGSMAQVGGFHLVAKRSDRQALARLANDLENQPSSDAGGGGSISPRLEAELIAMLTRPASRFQPGTAADRGQSAALFTLLGSMLGILMLSAVLWLNAMHGQIQQQTEAMEAMRAEIMETSSRQRLLLDAAVGEPNGLTPRDFVDRYAKAARERDETKLQLSRQASINELLAGKNHQLGADLSRLQQKYEEVASKVGDADDLADLRIRASDLQATADRQKKKISELETLLDTTEGRAAKELMEKYNRTWYVAFGGWCVGGLLLAGLLGGYAFLKFPVEEGTEPLGGPSHRIE